MTDPQGDPQLPSRLDPEVEEQLRAMLADARVTDPVPEDVAASLDETLAGLVAGGAAGGRRRWWTRVAAAAAAVFVLGGGTAFGLDRIAHSPGDSLSSGGALAPAAPATTPSPTAKSRSTPAPHRRVVPPAPHRSPRAPRSVPATAVPPSARQSPSAGATTPAGTPTIAGIGTQLRSPVLAQRGLPHIRIAHFDEDVRNLLANDPGPSPTAAPTAAPTGDPSTGSADPAGRRPTLRPINQCPGPDEPAEAERRVVLLDQRKAVLLITRTDEGRHVEAWSCDGDAELASTDLPG